MPIKPTTSTIFFVCAVALALAGCPRRASGIVGKWESAKTIGAVSARVKYTFMEDGRYTSEYVVSSKQGSLTTLESGTYKASDGKIVLTQTTATVNGSTIARKTPLTDIRRYRLNGDNLVLDDHRVDKVLLTRTNT